MEVGFRRGGLCTMDHVVSEVHHGALPPSRLLVAERCSNDDGRRWWSTADAVRTDRVAIVTSPAGLLHRQPAIAFAIREFECADRSRVVRGSSGEAGHYGIDVLAR